VHKTRGPSPDASSDPGAFPPARIRSFNHLTLVDDFGATDVILRAKSESHAINAKQKRPPIALAREAGVPTVTDVAGE
jgi:hypothetical protein